MHSVTDGQTGQTIIMMPVIDHILHAVRSDKNSKTEREMERIVQYKRTITIIDLMNVRSKVITSDV